MLFPIADTVGQQLGEDIIIIVLQGYKRYCKAEDWLTVCAVACLAGGANSQPQRWPSDSSPKEKTREIQPLIGTQC